MTASPGCGWTNQGTVWWYNSADRLSAHVERACFGFLGLSVEHLQLKFAGLGCTGTVRNSRTIEFDNGGTWTRAATQTRSQQHSALPLVWVGAASRFTVLASPRDLSMAIGFGDRIVDAVTVFLQENGISAYTVGDLIAYISGGNEHHLYVGSFVDGAVPQNELHLSSSVCALGLLAASQQRMGECSALLMLCVTANADNARSQRYFDTLNHCLAATRPSLGEAPVALADEPSDELRTYRTTLETSSAGVRCRLAASFLSLAPLAIAFPGAVREEFDAALGHEFFHMFTLAAFSDELRAAGATVLMDVGTHTGSFSFLPLIHPGLSVYAFEPVPLCFEALLHTCQLNQLDARVHPFRLAVSNYTGRTLLTSCVHSSSLTSLESPECAHTLPFDVRVTTLDAFADYHGISTVHAIKIDVEGHELSVVQGARGLIRRHKPLIALEVSLQGRAEDSAAVGLLMQWGYCLQPLSEIDVLMLPCDVMARREPAVTLYNPLHHRAIASREFSIAFVARHFSLSSGNTVVIRLENLHNTHEEPLLQHAPEPSGFFTYGMLPRGFYRITAMLVHASQSVLAQDVSEFVIL